MGSDIMVDDREELEIVGRRLSAAMAYRGIGAAELSGLSGVHRQTIWRYQTGKSTQSLDKMAKLAKALKVSLSYLAYGEGPLP